MVKFLFEMLHPNVCVMGAHLETFLEWTKSNVYWIHSTLIQSHLDELKPNQ